MCAVFLISCMGAANLWKLCTPGLLPVTVASDVRAAKPKKSISLLQLHQIAGVRSLKPRHMHRVLSATTQGGPVKHLQ